MQITRQRIINWLRTQGQATVEELATEVGLTHMAVRHHLNVLQAEDLIAVLSTKPRNRPGRPTQIYGLTNKARKLYPQQYLQLSNLLVNEIAEQIGKDTVSALFEGIADQIIAEAPSLAPNASIETRLNTLVAYLKEKGYAVEWRIENGQYTVYHFDCPYRELAQIHKDVCLLDQKITTAILGTQPHQELCIACGDDRCKYILQDIPLTNFISS